MMMLMTTVVMSHWPSAASCSSQSTSSAKLVELIGKNGNQYTSTAAAAAAEAKVITDRVQKSEKKQWLISGSKQILWTYKLCVERGNKQFMLIKNSVANRECVCLSFLKYKIWYRSSRSSVYGSTVQPFKSILGISVLNRKEKKLKLHYRPSIKRGLLFQLNRNSFRNSWQCTCTAGRATLLSGQSLELHTEHSRTVA